MAKYVLIIQDKILQKIRIEEKVVKESISCWLSRLGGLAVTQVKQLAINLIEVPQFKEKDNIGGMTRMRHLIQSCHRAMRVPFQVINSQGKLLTTHRIRRIDMVAQFVKIRAINRPSLQCTNARKQHTNVRISRRDLALLRQLSQVTCPAMCQITTTSLESASAYRETTTASATNTFNLRGKTDSQRNVGICLRVDATKKENRSFPGARVFISRRSVPYRKTVDVILYL